MKLVFAGTPEVAVPSLEALLDSGHEVVAVVTRPDAPSGRGRRLQPSPVAARAAEAGLEILRPERPRDADFVTRLTKLAPDCCPVVAYGALIPQRVIDIPEHGWVNLHFSLLPAWRGAAPVQHAIINGDQITGAATFSLVKEMDAGPVYRTVTDPIGATDTAGDLLHRLSLSGAQLLVQTLDGIEAGTLTPEPQPADGISLAPKITVDDARLDWTRPAIVVDRLIRGCTPAPGAWSSFRGDRFKINSATVDERDDLDPGELEITKKSVRVGTGAGSLILTQVQAQGKKPMQAADWARGVSFEPGERLGG
ncbi:methionyl-tRNA formyltransferase [Microlunatus elymi]|uniref:Methionyl-tRNA formyltransferase n=1 Tax=Microlunatus elymi TaxID=2596828 RepID=A0A516Q015_9ACTN|nr:methionyl-tRNA formyltransferase [Microlunatus elymi]QDP96760.1 methionyl-tRNA formyltransferase [Microlunatus elymi]